MRSIVLAVALTALTSPARADTALPDWLEGAWLSCAGGEAVTEIWTGAGSGVLVGVNHTRATRGPAFEFMRIAPGADGAVTFFASPNGAPPTPFRLTAHDAIGATFENPAHDFPQRVIYARDGAYLTGRIEGTINGKSEHMEWRFRRARVGERCG